jgi:hypothetical protein
LNFANQISGGKTDSKSSFDRFRTNLISNRLALVAKVVVCHQLPSPTFNGRHQERRGLSRQAVRPALSRSSSRRRARARFRAEPSTPPCFDMNRPNRFLEVPVSSATSRTAAHLLARFGSNLGRADRNSTRARLESRLIGTSARARRAASIWSANPSVCQLRTMP